MVQTSSVVSISKGYNDIGSSKKEKLRFSQLIRCWKPDITYGVSSDALGLKHFEGHVWPYRYLSNIRRLAASFWIDDCVMKNGL